MHSLFAVHALEGARAPIPKILSGLDSDTLLHVAKSLGSTVSQRPWWKEDVLVLVILCRECDALGLQPQFEALEQTMRQDVARQMEARRIAQL